MSEFLQKHDVIEIKKGMKIYADLPRKFAYNNTPLSNHETSIDITVGEVKTNAFDVEETKEQLIKDIQTSFRFQLGENIDEAKIMEFVNQILDSVQPETFDTSIFEGEYVVTRAFSHSTGHHVFCRKLKKDVDVYDENDIYISFYQSGFYMAIIKDISPIRKFNTDFSE